VVTVAGTGPLSTGEQALI